MKDVSGKKINLKWKRIDDNKIKLFNKTDSVIRLKITITAKEPLENKSWYKTAQCLARVLMMVRNASISYRNQYAMSLPGFMPTVGDALGQTRGYGATAPGVDFALGLIDDNYNDSVATPATTNRTEDIQIRLTLEPVKDLKIDLNASRTATQSKSIQYMYAGNPTTQSGTLTMTTLSLGSVFESQGSAANGYHSETFNRFVQSLDNFRNQVEAQYIGKNYPTSFGGGQFNPSRGAVNKYSADVMVHPSLYKYARQRSQAIPHPTQFAAKLDPPLQRSDTTRHLPGMVQKHQHQPLLQKHIHHRLVSNLQHLATNQRRTRFYS